MENTPNKINVLIPFFNPGEYFTRCINSLLSQRYMNFRAIFIDDASTDRSFEKIPMQDKRILYIRNEKNLSALPNLHKAIMEYCEPDSICVTLDGDDSFLKINTLDTINKFYNEQNCLFQYGQSIWTNSQRGCASKYSKEEYENVAKAPFRVSHIRSFKSFVYHSIKLQDETFSCMKDKNGEFYRSSYDTAIFIKLMQLIPYEKVYFSNVPLYLYNIDNELNDHKLNQSLQWSVHKEVSNKPVLKKLENFL